MRHLFIFGIALFALASSASAADTARPTTLALACTVMFTIPALDQTPGQPMPSTLSPILPQSGGGPAFATYYVNIDLARGVAELRLTDPDSNPWATFSTPQDLVYLRDHMDFYYMDHGHYTDTAAFPSDKTDLALWVGRVTGWFELIRSTYNPPSPYPSKSWEVGICGQRGWKF